jgi:hypothetical protein
MKERIKTYSEFYQFYLTEHNNSTSRRLHFIGTALVFLEVILLSYFNIWNFWFILPITGYAFAWVGHFFFEKNKPATFKYPLWSLTSDFRLFFEILIGKQKL